MTIAFWALAFIILVQIIGFSFWLGKLSQQVNDLSTQFKAEGIATNGYRKEERDKSATNLKESRDQTATNFKEIREQAASDLKEERALSASQLYQVLPECQASFMNLNSGISELKGKIDMLILIVNKK